MKSVEIVIAAGMICLLVLFVGISLQDTNAPAAGRYYRVWWDQL